MSNIQRVIKYLAIAFGIFLTVTIIGAIVTALVSIAGIFIGVDSYEEKNLNKNSEIIQTIEDYSNISNLDIDLSIYNLEIKEGNNFKIEVSKNADKISYRKEGTTLVIEDKDTHVIWNEETLGTITLYIPRDFKFNEASIKTGISKSEISDLNSDILNLELGVGNTEIENIIASKANITGGVGKVDIDNFMFNELNLETGVGKFDLEGKILNNGHINCGVGKVDLELLDTIENYSVKTNIGIGKIKLNNKDCSNDTTYGEGKIKLDINGGIGAVDITTK